MLYFFYGSDKDKAREEANALIESLRKKKPEAEVFRIDSENWNAALMEEMITGQGLFNKTYVVEIVSLFENPEAKEHYLQKLESVSASPNIFVMRESVVDKETLLAVTNASEKVQLFAFAKGRIKNEFNIFSLADAFGRRDKKILWVLCQKAVASGAVPEEIHGTLFWQMKNMLLAKQCKTAKEANLNPLPWSKAKTFERNWSEEELKSCSRKFVSLYHDSHRGIHDFGVALERFILAL